MVKNLLASAGDERDVGSIPRSGRSLGVGNGNLLQYSCLENSLGGGAWRSTVLEATKSQTQLVMHTHIHMIYIIVNMIIYIILYYNKYIVVVQLLSHIQLLATP